MVAARPRALARTTSTLKRNLESANTVNQQQARGRRPRRFDDAKTDLEDEHNKHEPGARRPARQGRPVPDRDRTSRRPRSPPSTPSSARSRRTSPRSSRLAQDTLRELRDQLERKETVLDQPDGRVTYVDYSRGEVRTNLTVRMGARPQMSFTIFDSQLAGHPDREAQGDDRADLRRRPLQHRPDRQDRSTRSTRSASATSSTRRPGRPTSRCGSP